MKARLEYRRLRAPQADGEALFNPPLDELAGLLSGRTAPADGGGAADADLGGRRLGDLSGAARREMLAAAVDHTFAYRDVRLPEAMAGQPDGPAAATLPIVLAGHQPWLFHPGVWLKNFVLAATAARAGGVGVNLLIDSDTLKSCGVRVPGGTPAAPHASFVPLDRDGEGHLSQLAFEERPVVDGKLFRSFGPRACDVLRPLVPDPLLAGWWPRAVARLEAGRKLGEALAEARHQQEGDWGAETLELPMSGVCGLPSFAHFAAWLLVELPRVWQLYNEALAEYRIVHRLRSAAQPLPDLALDEDWLEAPLWIWTSDDPRRRPLFAQRSGDRLQLTDRQGWRAELATGDDDVPRVADQLGALAAEGVKIRSRALSTTLFARLLLGDLFLHGIGGAKYDQLTDRLIAGLLGIEAPPFGVVSATLTLPVAIDRPAADAPRRLARALREIEYHPERFFSDQPPDLGPAPAVEVPSAERAELDRLLAEKRRSIAGPKSPQGARERHAAIAGANAGLRRWLTPQREALLAAQRDLDARIRAASILTWREYAFCLYPEEKLRGLLLDLPHENP